MIKVNLLRDQTIRPRRTVVQPRISRMGLVMLTLFVIAAGGMGAWWHYLDSQVKSLTVTRDRLREENNRLQALKREIAEFEKMKRLRENRIQVIENLKENQTGPVSLLNHVIAGIPRSPNLWLTSIDQKSERVQIRGYALRRESIPDFMINLSASGFFKSVDLETMEEEKDAAKFSLLCISTKKVVLE